MMIMMSNTSNVNCIRCNYEWVPRVENPKECPNCKARLFRQKQVLEVQNE